jgi:hypothetical protein
MSTDTTPANSSHYHTLMLLAHNPLLSHTSSTLLKLFLPTWLGVIGVDSFAHVGNFGGGFFVEQKHVSHFSVTSPHRYAAALVVVGSIDVPSVIGHNVVDLFCRWRYQEPMPKYINGNFTLSDLFQPMFYAQCEC